MAAICTAAAFMTFFVVAAFGFSQIKEANVAGIKTQPAAITACAQACVNTGGVYHVSEDGACQCAEKCK